MKKRVWTLIEVAATILMLGSVLWAESPMTNSKNGPPRGNSPASQKVSTESAAPTTAQIAASVRHQLAMLPWYNVFDWLDGKVTPQGEVILRGQVVLPVTKTDAENSVRHLPGVTGVKNDIEVLPVSIVDDRLRMALYRSIFKFDSPLFQYEVRAVPPIHIIVKNGNVTLKGYVANKMDSQIAYTDAMEVPGVFGVANDLKIG